jgi:hypothetical protein
MANTYTLISSNVLASSAASVTFSSIPSTYTDLVLRMSMRNNDNSTRGYVTFRMNSNSGTVYSTRVLLSDGATVSNDAVSTRADLLSGLLTDGNTATTNTFSNVEMYIPSYTANQNKPISIFGVTETNATTTAMTTAVAGLFRDTNAISSITIYPDTNASPAYSFVSGSSFYLYGIKNS